MNWCRVIVRRCPIWQKKWFYDWKWNSSSSDIKPKIDKLKMRWYSTFKLYLNLKIKPPPLKYIYIYIYIYRERERERRGDLNQVVLRLLSKFGDPNLNRWWVMLTHRRTDTDMIRQRQYLETKNWPRVKTKQQKNRRDYQMTAVWMHYIAQCTLYNARYMDNAMHTIL